MPLSSLFRRNRHRAKAHAAYASIVERARAPEFFLRFDVPDTLDGRFEMIALHMFLVLNRLKAEHEVTSDFAQALFDAMFADLDRGLREMGASDIGVGRRVKEMAKGFYGRIRAYQDGLAADDATLGDALRRNLYGTVQPRPEAVAAMLRYARAQAAALAQQPAENLFSDNVKFEPITN
ncbi:MAG TPA: ubiquinol-cytochrome C chaperone family protein [Stellaceae bacterium]|nr:ubiquinol-cytochrome C chaperone family protein [Stellaceae bacterium]